MMINKFKLNIYTPEEGHEDFYRRNFTRYIEILKGFDGDFDDTDPRLTIFKGTEYDNYKTFEIFVPVNYTKYNELAATFWYWMTLEKLTHPGIVLFGMRTEVEKIVRVGIERELPNGAAECVCDLTSNPFSD